ncbi:MAG: phospholipase/carboxylesterase [Actinomycetota bacterium]|jgi:phospholipase/carboxylesterase|nr:phospholipase/carboxylesterase [Actinomycetota bacterium]
MSDELIHRLRLPKGQAEGALVLLHGRGADENDLLGVFDMLDPDHRLLCLSPRGPLTLPPGGAHWYVVKRVGYPDPDTFQPTYDRLTGWLDGFLAQHEIPMDKTVIGGFSQGAVMSYAVSLGKGRPTPAAIVALSGFIPTVDGFEIDLSKAAGLPVAIGHGTFDPVITVDFGKDARNKLEGAGANVLYKESPMAHTIDPEFVAQVKDWLPV